MDGTGRRRSRGAPAASIRRSARGRRIALDILVPLALSLLGALATLELGYRLFYQLIPLEVCASDPIMANYVCQPYFVYDKPIRIGYRYRPGYRTEGWWDPAKPTRTNPQSVAHPSERSDAFWYVFETDEMGFPNSEYRWRDHYDLVITGDSFVLRTAPKTWIELLQEQTGQSALVLGASSWGTVSEVEAVKQFGLDKTPEWVLLIYFEGNDLLNVGEYIRRRESGLSWKEYDLQGVPAYRRLVAWHMLRYWSHELLTEEPEPTYRYPVRASTYAGEVDLIFQDIHLLPLSVDYDTLARSEEYWIIRHSLAELNRLCQAQGARLVLIYVPCKEHIYWPRIWDPADVNRILERTARVTIDTSDDFLLEWVGHYLDFETFYRNHNAQERLVAAMAQEEGIEFLNLTPVFWEASLQLGETYHYADPHWNQAGNQIAAEAIASYLLQH